MCLSYGIPRDPILVLEAPISLSILATVVLRQGCFRYTARKDLGFRASVSGCCVTSTCFGLRATGASQLSGSGGGGEAFPTGLILNLKP